MSPVGIQFEGQIDGQTWIRFRGVPLIGHWLAEYDPEAREGTGQARFSENPAEALQFPDFDAAKAFWEQESSFGTKPLTCCNIHVATLPGGLDG